MCEHATALHAAEDELALRRGLLATVTAWINNPAHDHAARLDLANHLGLPAPSTPRRDTP